MATENPYFTTFTEGNLRAKEISVQVVPSSRKVSDEGLRLELDRRWDEFTGKKRTNDINPSRFRFEGFEVDGGHIVIKVSPTVSFKDSKAWGKALTDKHGLEAAPLPISVTTLIETADGKLVLTKRIPEKNDYKPGGLSGVGGFMDIKEDLEPDGTPSVLKALRREAQEESGICPGEMVASVLHNVVHNPVSGSVDLVCWSKTSLDSNTIKNRDNDRENDLLFVDLDADVLQDLVLTKTNAFTVGVLSVLIDKVGELTRKKGGADHTPAIFRLRGISYAEAISRGPGVVRKLELRDTRK